MSGQLDPHTLRACPFCGKEPESNEFYVWCKDGSHGLVNVPRSSWNHRATAEAPPETGCICGEQDGMAVYRADCPNRYHQLRALRADVARLTEQVREWRAEAESAGDRARAECALRREVEAERNASLAMATDAAETVARLLAERDTLDCTRREGGDTRHCRLDRKCLRCRLEQAEAERDAARAQVWAEAVAVVEQVREYPTIDYPVLELVDRDAVLAVLRAAQERQK